VSTFHAERARRQTLEAIAAKRGEHFAQSLQALTPSPERIKHCEQSTDPCKLSGHVGHRDL
jgi:hypothetical protein